MLWPLCKARMDSYPTFDLERETDDATHTPWRGLLLLFKGLLLIYVHSEEGRAGQSLQEDPKWFERAREGDWLWAFLVVRGWGQGFLCAYRVLLGLTLPPTPKERAPRLFFFFFTNLPIWGTERKKEGVRPKSCQQANLKKLNETDYNSPLVSDDWNVPFFIEFNFELVYAIMAVVWGLQPEVSKENVSSMECLVQEPNDVYFEK